jgi:polysaccharide biosynthesis transport protein
MDVKDFTEELDFYQYWLVLKRRWIPLTVVLGLSLAAAMKVSSQQVKSYTATGQLLFKSDRTAAWTGIKNELGQIQALTQKTDPLMTQAELVKSKAVLQAATQALKLTDKDGKVIDADVAAAGLSVTPMIGTDILEVTYSGLEAEVAAKLVNQVMQSYILWLAKSNRASAEKTREFIRQQLPNSEAAVRRAEDLLKRFRQANGIVNLQQESVNTVESIANLDSQIVEAQAKLRQADAKLTELSTQVGMGVEDGLVVANLNQSDSVQQGLKELQQIQSELAKERARYTSKHPTIAELERKEAGLKAVLEGRVANILGSNQRVAAGTLQVGKTRQDLIAELARAQVERLTLAQNLGTLSVAQQIHTLRSSSMPELEKTEREINRQLEAAQSTYKTLLTKLQEVQVQENQTLETAQILTEAITPAATKGAPKMLFLLGGGVVGLLLGVGTAFMIDALDQSVKTFSQAHKLLRYPVLGMIPRLDYGWRRVGGDRSLPRLLTFEHPDFLGQESFNMLRANLQFATPQPTAQVIALVSAVRKEGRSTLVANLALALSQGQRKILVIDADLRHPAQHHIWHLANAQGLTNIIVGQSSFDQAVTHISPTLDVLTAGAMPPNPMALLDSVTMGDLVNQLKQEYALILIDTPALTQTADAGVLARLADGCLVAVRPGVIKVKFARSARQFLVQSQQRVLGLVANDLPRKELSYHSDEAIVSGPPTVEPVPKAVSSNA